MKPQAFAYACNQWAGLQFEPFTYANAEQRCVWNPIAPVKNVCTALVNMQLKPVAQVVFNVFAKVEAR